MIDLDRELKTLKGENFAMSFPSRSDLEKATSSDGTVELPNETVKNVLINCLASYAVKDNKEVFIVNLAAQWVISENQRELTEKIKEFIVKDVLPQSIYIEKEKPDGEKTFSGLYRSWVIMQVYEAFGVTEA